MEDYKILRKLGSGNFATVYLALHLPTSTQVALKLIDNKKLTSPKVRQKVDREISNMEKLRHCNIVQIFESFETTQHTMIAMEYMPRGELFDYVLERRGLNEGEAREMFVQIVEALDYCHKNSLVHRDLKLENILLDEDFRPKLADFGFSREFSPHSTLSTYCGSPLYASPEMIFGKPYHGPECDVWSLGVILYCMLTANMPFDDSNPARFLQVIQSGRYTPPPSASDSARDLISKMLDPNPKTRASVSEVLGHAWTVGEWRCKSVNPQQQHQHQQRQRKVSVCHSRSEAAEIATALFKIGGGGGVLLDTGAKDALCQCTCHEGLGAREFTFPTPEDHHHRKDSAFTPTHCEDCSLRPATVSLMVHRNRSNCSSGYGSESGSTVFAPRLSVASSPHAEGPATPATRKRSQPSPKEPPAARNSLVVPPSFTQCQQRACEDLVFV